MGLGVGVGVWSGVGVGVALGLPTLTVPYLIPIMSRINTPPNTFRISGGCLSRGTASGLVLHQHHGEGG